MSTQDRLALLNDRERQVLDLWYTEELSQKQIAARLDLSTRTVEGVFHAIRRKLECGPWHPAKLCKLLAAAGWVQTAKVAA